MSEARRGGGLGGGGIWLGIAKLWFLVASYAITIALTRFLDPAEYGQYYAVARLIAVPNMVIIYTLLFSVSRPLAAEYEDGLPSYALLRTRGLRMAATLGGVTSLGFFVGAPVFADWLNDPSLTGPIQMVAPISMVYALYAVNLGTLNAVRRFGLQASLDISMATLKSGLIIAAAAAGLGLTWTVGGFTGASVLALLLSVVLVIRGRPQGAGTGTTEGSAAPMAQFAGILVIFTAVVNFLQSVDVLILKGWAQTQAQSDAVGFYSSAQQVALVPYSLMNAVALLMFPLIASLDPQREPGRVKTYVGETAKVSVLLLCFMSAVGSACAAEVQALLFPKAYGAAASELRLLVWGFSGYSFAVTIAWICNSTKRSRLALVLVSVPLLLVVTLTNLLVPEMFTFGAALAVAIAGGVAVVVALVGLHRAYGAGVPLPHILKVLAAVAAVELLARLWPAMSTAGLSGKLLILVKLVALAVAFVAVVGGTRAVTLRQLQELRRAR